MGGGAARPLVATAHDDTSTPAAAARYGGERSGGGCPRCPDEHRDSTRDGGRDDRGGDALADARSVSTQGSTGPLVASFEKTVSTLLEIFVSHARAGADDLSRYGREAIITVVVVVVVFVIIFFIIIVASTAGAVLLQHWH